jgi:predicted phage baseplate assembly protein
MTETCGCCAGVEAITPAPNANRPGLSALLYRVGTHAQFLATMQADLSRLYIPEPAEEGSDPAWLRPLQGLTARQGDDPAIALLDAWAIVADVLTFYQERIANEGYLRTATERRSILELARLVGYDLRPGVASSVYLAYELEQPLAATPPSIQAPRPNDKAALEQVPPAIIPAGSRAQSVPGPGELPQAFETSELVQARPEWNAIRPRLTRPQRLTKARFANGGSLYLKGLTTSLKPNDPLMLNFGAKQLLYRVTAVKAEPLLDRSEVRLEPWEGPLAAPDASPEKDSAPATGLSNLIRRLEKPPSIPPANRLRLGGSLAKSFAAGSDTAARIVTAVRPSIAQTLYAGWRSLPVTQPIAIEAHALRARATLFGSNAQKQIILPLPQGSEEDRKIKYDEWDLSTDAPTPMQIEVMIVAAESGGSTSSESSAGPSEPAEVAVILRIRIGQTAPFTSEALPLPLPGSSTDLSFTIGGDPISLTLTNAGQAEGASLLVSFDRRKSIIVFEINYIGGDFRVNSRSDMLSEVDVFGDLSTIGTLAAATGRLPLVMLRAQGMLPDPDPRQPSEAADAIWLDSTNSQILPRSWLAMEIPQPNGQPRVLVARIQQASEGARADYGMSAKTSYLKLDRPWLDPGDTFAVIRGSAVYAQSEQLELAEEPIPEPIADDAIELGMLVDGLTAGRWLIVAGERADIPDATGVRAAELVMLAGVRQGYDPGRAGDRTLSTLLLAKPLAYRYARDTVTIYANVAHATHGETRSEVLGAGDGAKANQRFTLRQSPLTYVSAPTPDGIESTLEVRVNDLLWHASDSLAGLGPTDRSYITRADDEARTTIIFGNGREGARLPTGAENVKAVYRSGIGAVGNVAAGKINLLATRPLGVKGVINPLPATGGADRESRDQGRENAPLGVTALDRLVSVQDYEDFARTFAGIGKASARRFTDHRRQIVHLTIAGADDIPIAETSDLFRNLRQALYAFGDQSLPLRVQVRELLMLVLDANVKLHPDYLWEAVEPKIRAQLLNTFSFGRRALGQDALLTEAIAAIHSVAGVEYVDIDAFGAIPEKLPDRRAKSGRRTPSPRQIGELVRQIASDGPRDRVPVGQAAVEEESVRPAQLAILLPDVAETLALRPISGR